jgi:hypothetical protein
MARTKYGKYILRGEAWKKPSPKVPGILQSSPKDWQGIQHRINWNYISRPVVMEDEPHSHDFPEFLYFLGTNPADPKDFGAEIEISMGKEGEKHKINTATIVCIPKGTVHSSINFKKVDKTVIYGTIYMAPEYKKKPVK